MPLYREIPPSPAFADRIECFWTMDQDAAGALHRVVPDGCADILLSTRAAGAALDAVGPMTRYRDHETVAGRHLFGVRFRPGRWPGEHTPDAVLPLDDLFGARARRLLDRLADAPSDLARARIVESILPPDEPGPVERAIAFLERSAGRASLDDLARDAGLSSRQFRRRCLEATGYTPKLLARVLRFRNAARRLAAGAPDAIVALDCGYFDQSHLIADYRAFAGTTPSARATRQDAP